jgi:hypothetical protein
MYVQVIQCGGQDRTLWHPAFISLGVDISPSTETLNFLCERNEVISLIIIRSVENSIVDNLYSKPGCHNVFSISKNTAAVDIFMWSVSLIHLSVVL